MENSGFPLNGKVLNYAEKLKRPEERKGYKFCDGRYRARRPANNCFVYGILVKNDKGKVEGILNEANRYAELAWIDEDTIESISDDFIG